LAVSVATVGGGVGAGASVGVGAFSRTLDGSVVATGGVVFLVDGARSLHAARDAVMATAVRIFVNRIEVDI
jgi:hypothetical protein